MGERDIGSMSNSKEQNMKQWEMQDEKKIQEIVVEAQFKGIRPNYILVSEILRVKKMWERGIAE